MPTDQELNQYKEAAEEAVERAKKAREDDLRRQEQANAIRVEAEGAKHKEADKRRALQAWIHNGGTVDDFDAQWEKLYKDIVYQRTLQAMAGGSSGGRRVASL